MLNPFKITEPTCISFSGGRTSAYMLWRVLQANQGLPDEAIVCFANTGKEHEATLEFVRDCGQQWGIPIHWLEFVSRSGENKFIEVDFDTASRNGEPFDRLIDSKKFLPNAVMRFCSEELKGKTISRFTGLNEENTMVGIRADEPIRIAKMRRRGLRIPLVDAKVYKSLVRAFWNAQPFDLGIKERNGITDLGNCDLCFLKGLHQIASIIAAEPSRAVWWMKAEERIKGTFHNNRPSYAQIAKFAAEQRDMFDPTEESIACFCGD